MKRATAFLLCSCTASLAGQTAEPAVPWKVRSILSEDAPTTCRESAVELVLESPEGERLGRHVVTFDDVHDAAWPVDLPVGEYRVGIDRTDCSGVRTRVGVLETERTSRVVAKQLYVFAAVLNGALHPRFLEIDTYFAPPPGVEARREGHDLIVSNGSDAALLLCSAPGILGVRDEFRTDDRWRSHGGWNWSVPDDVTVIEPGGELTLDRSSISVYVPPGETEWVRPNAARVLLTVRPARTNHIAFGGMPGGIAGLPGCDGLYIPRSVTEKDRIVLEAP